MNLTLLAKRFGKMASDNSPALLTTVGVTGALATAYLTGQAAFKAAEVIRQAEDDRNKKAWNDPDVFPLEPKEKVELTWKLFVPAVGTAAITVACIIAANNISTRRAAAFASAYSLSEKAFDEYKKKVVDKIGEKKEQAVVDAIAQDRVTGNEAVNSHVLVVSGRVLCLDLHSGRVFESDMERIRSAVNDTNQQVINENYASLTAFYERIGLSPTAESDEIGWNPDELLEVQYSTALDDNNRPCLTIGFRAKPVRYYDRLH